MADKGGSVFGLDEFRPYKRRFDARAKVFEQRRQYYAGEQYSATQAMHRIVLPGLYDGVRGLYLMLHRAVDIMSGLIPGGWVLDKGVSEAVGTAMGEVLRWSRWATEGVLFTHYGAMYGNSVLRVVDDRANGRVLIQPMNPAVVLLVERGVYDETPAMAIVRLELTDGEGDYEYAEVITSDRVRTFRNGEPMGFGDRPAEYVNALGFVPFVEVRHKNTGGSTGESTFDRVMTVLDEVNELASMLMDSARKHVNAQWAAFGAEPAELERGDNVWFFPTGSSLQAIVADLNIADVLGLLQDMKQEMKDALPELGYAELKSASQVAVQTVEIKLGELVVKVKRCRSNYDAGLAAALALAGRAGQSMKITRLGVLAEPGAVVFDEQRDVLPRNRREVLEMEMLEQTVELQRRSLMGP